MLSRLGITVPAEEIKLKNVASVIVTASIPYFASAGMQVDVTVSSLGDARSLEGGILLMTPVKASDGVVYAHAQGPVSIGGFNIQSAGGDQIRKNYTLVGRVPDGAQLIKSVQPEILKDNKLGVLLRNPDFTTATKVTDTINKKYGDDVARAVNAGEILVHIPAAFQAPEKYITFISELESMEVSTDRTAKIVINERTGTIVIGEHVKIRPVAVAHGNLNIEIQSTPVISQPSPLSGGQTVVTSKTETSVVAEQKRLMVLDNVANVKDVAIALNTLGVTPRDLIAIFQALKKAEAINAELVIM